MDDTHKSESERDRMRRAVARAEGRDGPPGWVLGLHGLVIALLALGLAFAGFRAASDEGSGEASHELRVLEAALAATALVLYLAITEIAPRLRRG